MRSQGWYRLIYLAVPAALSILTSACAAVSETAAQRFALERWRACESLSPGAQLELIDLDGRIRFWHLGAWDRRVLLDCIGQMPPGGPILPEPIPLQQPRGV